MRALVLYSSTGKLDELARGLETGLRAAGYEVQLMEAGTAMSTPIITAGQYDLVCVGSPAEGLLGGSIAADVASALKRLSRLQGRPCAAFVKARLIGSARSLRTLMEAMEAQGAWVQDFAAVHTPADAERLGKRLERVQKL
jgi:menaquinone-dependent protoporphyrinogen IX oxidase